MPASLPDGIALGRPGAAAAATLIQATARCSCGRKRYVVHQTRRRAAARRLCDAWSLVRSERRARRAAVAIQRIQRGRSDRLAAAAARERNFALDSHSDMALDGGYAIVPREAVFCGVLEAEPQVTVVDGFLAPSECSELIALASLRRRSGVSNELGTGSRSAGRSSTTALRTPALVRALAPLRRRLTALLGVAEARLEASMVLCYEVGGAYRWHFDAFDLASVRGAANTASHGGQRLLTSIAYLSDVPAGGETAFFHLRRAVAPKAGRLLVFRNVAPRAAADGRPRLELERRSLHAGLPVRRGTKWIVTTFVRERERCP